MAKPRRGVTAAAAVATVLIATSVEAQKNPPPAPPVSAAEDNRFTYRDVVPAVQGAGRVIVGETCEFFEQGSRECLLEVIAGAASSTQTFVCDISTSGSAGDIERCEKKHNEDLDEAGGEIRDGVNRLAEWWRSRGEDPER